MTEPEFDYAFALVFFVYNISIDGQKVLYGFLLFVKFPSQQ